jgi:hypothetical protein
MAINKLVMMMSNMGMGVVNPLQFNNTDATFYSFDIEGDMKLSDKLSLRAIASIVRGQRDDDLYRVSPDNVILELDY